MIQPAKYHFTYTFKSSVEVSSTEYKEYSLFIQFCVNIFMAVVPWYIKNENLNFQLLIV